MYSFLSLILISHLLSTLNTHSITNTSHDLIAPAAAVTNAALTDHDTEAD